MHPLSLQISISNNSKNIIGSGNNEPKNKLILYTHVLGKIPPRVFWQNTLICAGSNSEAIRPPRTIIKISPANPMGGAEYIEDLLRPMKFLNIIASGSIKIEDVQSYLKAGVKAVGLGRALYKNASYEEITQRARLACEKAKGM